MKTIHHIIVAAMDAGMSETDAQKLATEILSKPDPVSFLNQDLVDIEERIRLLTKARDARQAIRAAWIGNGSRTYANIEDTKTPERRLRG